MLYSFSSNAFEMAESTVKNYLKYNFYNPGTYGTDFAVSTTRIGQLQMDFPVVQIFFMKFIKNMI